MLHASGVREMGSRNKTALLDWVSTGALLIPLYGCGREWSQATMDGRRIMGSMVEVWLWLV